MEQISGGQGGKGARALALAAARRLLITSLPGHWEPKETQHGGDLVV